MNDDREVGQVLEGIRNLDKRFDNQEKRLSRVEENTLRMQETFARQPYVCLKATEEKFITKEKFKPIEDTHSLVKRSVIVLVVTALGSLTAIILYIKGAL